MSKYTIEQKNKAVKLALQSSSTTAASRMLNIPISTLHAWIRDYKLHNKASPSFPSPDIKKELIKKDKELKKLKEELEILKKFRAFSLKRQP